jgi:hypothetical protein
VQNTALCAAASRDRSVNPVCSAPTRRAKLGAFTAIDARFFVWPTADSRQPTADSRELMADGCQIIKDQVL